MGVAEPQLEPWDMFRGEERFAFKVVQEALGVSVRGVDFGGKPGIHDAEFRTTDGDLAALEVTTIGDPRQFEFDAQCAKAERKWRVVGSRWTWWINCYDWIDLNSVEARLQELAELMESNGVNRLEHLHELLETDAVAWYFDSPIRITGYPSHEHHGLVEILDAPIGGCIDRQMTGLVDWFQTQATNDPVLIKRIEKLARSEVSQRHLFVRVDRSGIPFSLLDPLGFSEAVPEGEIDHALGLDGLWLQTHWGSCCYWLKNRGWNRYTHN